MTSAFFTEQDDFESILKNILGGISMAPIATGWTNFVFEVTRQSDGAAFIARFPRGPCFSRAMVSDVEAAHFIQRSTDIKTPRIALYYDRERPFSVHEKIPGKVLSAIPFAEIPASRIEPLARGIARFFAALHSVWPPEGLLRRPLSSFLRQVMGEVPLFKDSRHIDALERAEKERPLVAVHGDLNAGNIIVEGNFEIAGFLDFAFFGVSVPETDLARMVCRLDPGFFERIVANYEALSGRTLDKALLEQQKVMWLDIEDHYIAYMASVMPDIVVL